MFLEPRGRQKEPGFRVVGRVLNCPDHINVPAQLYKNSEHAKAVINQLNRLEQEKYRKLCQLLCLEVAKIN